LSPLLSSGLEWLEWVEGVEEALLAAEGEGEDDLFLICTHVHCVSPVLNDRWINTDRQPDKQTESLDIPPSY
jgi:hypothetical protein